MKITLELEDRIVTVEDNQGLYVDDILYLFKDAIVALGYHYISIEDSIIELAEQIKLTREDNINE